MVDANRIILDQIARIFILLSDPPPYWFTLIVPFGWHNYIVASWTT
jgi:hypothetical protein